MKTTEKGQKVIVAGHICLDITPVFKSDKVGQPSDVLSPGKLIHLGKADIHTGGIVANTGLTMHFFGANATLVSKIDKDSFGQVIVEILANITALLNLLKIK